jgi:catechol 2,3-dioxygenase-like lactoylglutathione lyase family enzyme
LVSREISVAVMVSDAKRSARWFKESLGFQTSADGHWVLAWPRGSTAKVHLCEGKPEPGNSGIAFYTKGLAAYVKKLKAKGVKFSKELTERDWGTYAMVEDEDGNQYWLIDGEGP